MKYPVCAECKHERDGWCGHELSSNAIDYSTGHKEYRTAWLMRNCGSCGPEGHLFEQRIPWSFSKWIKDVYSSITRSS